VNVALSPAGLFVRTFASLVTRPLGFDHDAVLVVQVDAQYGKVDPTPGGRLESRPGRSSAARACDLLTRVKLQIPTFADVLSLKKSCPGGRGAPKTLARQECS
jgi:hypothetical protein